MKRIHGWSKLNQELEPRLAMFPFTKVPFSYLAMGQKPVPPVNIPIPTKIDSNGWCTYHKMIPLVLSHSHFVMNRCGSVARRSGLLGSGLLGAGVFALGDAGAGAQRGGVEVRP